MPVVGLASRTGSAGSPELTESAAEEAGPTLTSSPDGGGTRAIRPQSIRANLMRSVHVYPGVTQSMEAISPHSLRLVGIDPSRKLRLIDAFAGAGGMTLGFTSLSAGCFVPVWANDYNDYAVATYNANFGGHCIGGDISDILSDASTKIPQADVVIGGPPCQGFSLLNRNRDGDARKQLWGPFLELSHFHCGLQVRRLEFSQ
jgi:hypothetical protein